MVLFGPLLVLAAVEKEKCVSPSTAFPTMFIAEFTHSDV